MIANKRQLGALSIRETWQCETASLTYMRVARRDTEAAKNILGLLLQAYRDGRDVDGWQIKKAINRSGPAVYKAIDELEDAGLVEGYLNPQLEENNSSRRRCYRLSAGGLAAARRLAGEPSYTAVPKQYPGPVRHPARSLT
jgi:DNA-binding PadR family transcriptional regulator